MTKLHDNELENVVGGVNQDEALAIALKHAGFTKEQLDFVKKVDLDYEHFRKIYEVRFYKGGMEYEYDIDAATGEILKFEKDYD